MLDPCNPLTHFPICRQDGIKHVRSKISLYDTAHHSHLVDKETKQNILSVRQMKKIKNVFRTNTNQLTPKQRGISCFSRAHSSQNSTAWQGGCYRSYYRPHYNGLCGKETSLIVFSQASFQTWGLSGPRTNGITVVPPALPASLRHRMLHNPNPQPYLKLLEHMEEGVLYKHVQTHSLIFFLQWRAASTAVSAMVTQPLNTFKPVHLTCASNGSGAIHK